MKKLKIITVVGTRPEIIRLSRVVSRLDEHCEHILVHTGQNYDYELNQIFFDDLDVLNIKKGPSLRIFISLPDFNYKFFVYVLVHYSQKIYAKSQNKKRTKNIIKNV